jgi:uncharacterized protein (DUF1684 family)
MDEDALQREIEEWRRGRVARLTAPDGWLSLVGKFELDEGEARVGSAPECEVPLPEGKAPALLATLQRQGERVQLTPQPGATLAIQRAGSNDVVPVTGAIALQTDAAGAADRVHAGPLRIEIMQRGSRFAVRVRDLESDGRQHFQGIPYFPISQAWRLDARFEPHPQERRIELMYDSGSELARAPGVLSFSIGGSEYRLEPVFDSNPDRLFVLFGDLTNRTESYGAGRFLYTPLPRDGRVLLDFNQAFSPPCAFTNYASCPLPPPQNRLPLRVEAGEKRPHV